MKKTHLSILILFLYALNLQAAVTFRIQTDLRNGDRLSGFGFFVYESDEYVYLVTAKHVVESMSGGPEVIKIHVYYEGYESEAQICEKHKTLDLALLKITGSISGRFKFRNRIAVAQIGDPVYIVGRYGGISKSKTGKVTDVSGHEIQAELEGVAVGSSGGPLMKKKTTFFLHDKIVGMVYSYDGSNVKAIPFNIIRQFVVESLNLNIGRISDLPDVRFGVQIPWSFPGSREAWPVKDYYEWHYSKFPLGLFAIIGFSKYFSVSVEKNSISFIAETLDEFLTPTRYQNFIDSYSIGIQYHPNTTLDEVGGIFFTLGYSFGRMEPLISIDYGEWVELKELGHQYSKNVNAVKFGFGFDVTVFNYCFLGITYEYEQFFNKYIYSYIVEPFEENQNNDRFSRIRIMLGFKLRRPGSYTKFLR